MFYSVIKKEITSFFVTPILYIFMTVFLLMSGLLTFNAGNFYERNLADLLSFFQWHVWLYLLLVPALTMRLWSEEQKSGTYELLLTLPCPPYRLILAKFFAAWILCAVALLLTLPFWLLVSWLGNPDHGIIITSYIGSLLLAGVFCAIGCMASSLTKNQAIAYILSLVIGFFITAGNVTFFLDLLAFFRDIFNISMVVNITAYSIITHMQNFIEGAPSLSNIVFLIGLIIMMLCMNYIIVTMHQLLSLQKIVLYYLLPLCIIFITVNSISHQFLTYRIDMTEDQLYQINSATKNYLGRLEQPIKIHLYYSEHMGQDYPEIAAYAQQLKSFLKQYQAYSNDMISIKWNKPLAFSKIEDDAIAQNINGIEISEIGDKFYFGLSITNDNDTYRSIPFLDPSKAIYFEYELTRMIDQLLRVEKPKIALISAIRFTPPPSPYQQAPSWYLRDMISERYDVVDTIDDDITAAIVIAPQNLSPKIMQQLKNYHDKNGKIVMFIDPYHSTAIENDLPQPDINTESEKILTELLQYYDINYHRDIVINREIAMRTQQQTALDTTRIITKPSWLGLGKEQLLQTNPIIADLSHIRLFGTGYFSYQGQDNFHEVLAFVEKDAMIVKDLSQLANTEDLLANYQPDGKKYDIILNAQKDNSQLLLIADYDMLYDAYWVNRQDFFGNEIITPMADNGRFVLNMLDYISGDNDIIKIRNRQRENRQFIVVDNLRRQAESLYLQQEQELINLLDSAEKKLEQLQNTQPNSEQFLLTDEQQREIEHITQKRLEYRDKLRQVQSGLRDDINALGKTLRLFFMMIYPLSILLLLLIGRYMLIHKYYRAKAC